MSDDLDSIDWDSINMKLMPEIYYSPSRGAVVTRPGPKGLIISFDGETREFLAHLPADARRLVLADEEAA